MAFSKTLLIVALAFTVLLVSAEVEAHRDLAETTTTTEQANTDGYRPRTRGSGRGRHGEHGGQQANTDGYGHGNRGYGGGYGGGHGGHRGHGPHAVESENEN